ncbi:YibE/F family protein [Schaalia naturae]|uniref:YibE/F family protein n=1 Tax=Schaalia naturae TaxID=635203 RepID=A0ABW2SJR7_9ACTO
MSHSHGHRGPAPASRTVVVGLSIVMVALFAATLVALALLWPRAADLPERRSFFAEGTREVGGTVLSIEDRGDVQGGENATVRVSLDGTDEQADVQLGAALVTDDIVGARMRLVEVPAAEGSSPQGAAYMFMDFHRGVPLIVLGVALAVVVIAVARLKGLAALVGLAGALALLWFFTLPALLAGRPSVAVALTTAGAVLFIVVYLAHGISVKSSTALLGTFAGIAVVTALAAWAIPASHLLAAGNEEMTQLAFYARNVDLRGVLLCGMVLGGVGVLNDVTITQASSVWELRAAAPEDTRWSIFARAMRIGRDHIASTVYTIAFAYVGGALGLLMLASTLDRGLAELVTFDDIAHELVGIAVASIGLVLAIPLTTAIAAALVGRPRH